MIKEAAISTLVAAALPAGYYVASLIYTRNDELPEKVIEIADSRYVRQDVYKQAVSNKRIWDLEDRINDIKDQADIEHRDLTRAEKARIRRWTTEIRKIQEGK